MTHAVLFDLDGTLVDSAPDLARALNCVCETHNQPKISVEQARQRVSDGARALIQLAFPEVTDEEPLQALREELLEHYWAGVCVDTVLFPQLDEIITLCESRKHAWGVVSNKPVDLCLAVMQGLHLDKRAQCIYGGDSYDHAKPHPMPLLEAAKVCSVPAKNCLYIGDHQRDIEAGQAAGMQTVAVGFGYHHADDSPHNWNADFVCDTTTDLLELIKKWPSI